MSERIDRDALWEEMKQAANDPLFLQDLYETQEAFKYVDAETARMIDDDLFEERRGLLAADTEIFVNEALSTAQQDGK